MADIGSVGTQLKSDITFLRKAENVRTDGRGLTGTRGGSGLTGAEAAIALDRLADQGVTGREMGVAIRDLPGLSAVERRLLGEALAARGGAETPGYSDIQIRPKGPLTAPAARQLVEAMVATSRSFGNVVIVEEASGGGYRNLSVQGDDDSNRPRGFDTSTAELTARILASHRASRANALAAVESAAISPADKALLRTAVEHGISSTLS